MWVCTVATYLDFTGTEARDSSRRRFASSSWVVGFGGVSGGMLESCTNGWPGSTGAPTPATPHACIPLRSTDVERLDVCVPVLVLELK